MKRKTDTDVLFVWNFEELPDEIESMAEERKRKYVVLETDKANANWLMEQLKKYEKKS